MGNKSSLNNKNNEEFLETIDNLVSKFLSQPKFQYYRNLSDQNECDRFFVLSKELLKKYLTEDQVTTLHKRINIGRIEFGKDIEIIRNKNKLNVLIEDIAGFYTTIANIISTISLKFSTCLIAVCPIVESITSKFN